MTQTEPDVRSRTFSWSDPSLNSAQLGRRGGLELLQAMSRGELPRPPIMHLLGTGALQAEDGRVVVTLEPQEYHYNPLGTVHGGVLATLLDTATGCAVHSTLPAGVGYTTLDLNARFLRPASLASGILTCEGVVLNRGRRTALAQARITDARGALVAHATSTCMIFEMPESKS
ncbi:PaaI family thioesterase [Dactylosporangium vinaceum]|uniref:PaaI family thioesterase n=1 Tax=Dactylosporangium vinaceum TaxID=53362 RepID=A0ABV5M4V4_9ACTN|nr:PaaI family thioesterase [Dactylosporangium vinaceum]UAB96041.1 PaaI family thioesterase [Dactylosporangium vinaceum]